MSTEKQKPSLGYYVYFVATLAFMGAFLYGAVVGSWFWVVLGLLLMVLVFVFWSITTDS